jgi:G3E family GTPase
VAGALAPTLKNLAMGRADGKLPPFERVIIETTGIADPAPVLDTLRNDRWIAARFQMDGVVTTVDALLGEQQLASHPEARRQAAVADRLVLTKTDLVAPTALSALEARLAELNPAALRITARQGGAALCLRRHPHCGFRLCRPAPYPGQDYARGDHRLRVCGGHGAVHRHSQSIDPGHGRAQILVQRQYPVGTVE